MHHACILHARMDGKLTMRARHSCRRMHELNATAVAKAHWRVTLPVAIRPSWTAPCAGGAFVSLISGPRYINAALCLARSLDRVASVCPYMLVHDDRPSMALPADQLQRVTLVLGPSNVIPVTALFSRLPNVEHRIRLNFTLYESFTATSTRSIPSPTKTPPAASAGRRLYSGSSGAELFVTHLKLWLFALPFARVIALDVDMVVVQNIDFLMAYEFPEHVAAVDACAGAFNSGLMIIKPSLSHLRSMLGLAKHAMHLKRACEIKPGDQSILNAHFRHGRWHRLPISLATKFKGKTNETWRKHDPALLHFSSEPKPWDAKHAPAAMQQMWEREFGCELQGRGGELRR